MPKAAEVILRQFFEMKLRSLVDLKVDRINVVDDRRDIANDAHLDRHGLCRRTEFLTQLSAGCTIECSVHVVVETTVVDAKFSHWQAGHAGESTLQKTLQRITVLCRKLLEYDERHLKLARMC